METTLTTPSGSKPHLEELTYSPKASLASSSEKAARAGAQRRQPAPRSVCCPQGERSEATVDSEQKVAVKLSHEIFCYSREVPSVSVFGTTLVCRYHVRHTDPGGVLDRGEAARGWAWNTGYPSENEEQSRMVETGLTTTQCISLAGGQMCAKKQTCEPRSSGSLSSGIVAIERWGTADGPDPLGSKGQNLIVTISAERHGPHTPR